MRGIALTLLGGMTGFAFVMPALLVLVYAAAVGAAMLVNGLV